MTTSPNVLSQVTRPDAATRRQRALDLLLGLGLLLAVALVTAALAGFPSTVQVLQAAALYLLLAVIVFRRLPGNAPGPGIGWANRVTLLRAVPVMLVAGLVGHGPYPDTAIWWVIALAVAVLLLDGVDGLVARRTGTTTAFGARFDMELDAALILLLALLVWLTGQTGAWVLLLGAMRYAFIAAGVIVPVLRRPLPDSIRRKGVCVVQTAALLICLVPVVSPGAASVIALLALGLLVYSFTVDVDWLLRRAPGSG